MCVGVWGGDSIKLSGQRVKKYLFPNGKCLQPNFKNNRIKSASFPFPRREAQEEVDH